MSFEFGWLTEVFLGPVDLRAPEARPEHLDHACRGGLDRLLLRQSREFPGSPAAAAYGQDPSKAARTSLPINNLDP